jgi:hypothetical protein
LPIQVI